MTNPLSPAISNPNLTPVEALFSLVIRADAFIRRRNKTSPTRFRQYHRTWIEPFFNAIGAIVGGLLWLIPSPSRRRIHIWMCQQMEQHAPEAFPDQARYQAEAVRRARSLQARTGQWPAVLFLTSHPDTVGSLAWLRFELLRQALWIADALAAASPRSSSHPRCFLAIDPYALDSVSVWVSALYAGLMHNQYLVWDRQPSTQSWLQRHWLLAGTGHHRVAWRLLRALRRDPVLMVLSGGLPPNARLFYAAREWAGTLKDAQRAASKHAIRYRVMDILSSDSGSHLPTETGRIPSETEHKLQLLLNELGYSNEDQRALLARLDADFKAETPMRLRLWRVLHARLARRGIPLLVLPLTDGEQSPHVRLGPYFEMTDQTDPDAFAQDIHAFYSQPLIK